MGSKSNSITYYMWQATEFSEPQFPHLLNSLIKISEGCGEDLMSKQAIVLGHNKHLIKIRYSYL